MVVDFATFLVRRGVVTSGQMHVALAQQSRSRPPIGRVAMQARMLSVVQVFSILAYQARNAPMRFGESAVALKLLKPAQVEELLRMQRKLTMPLEEILVRAGVLDHESARALAKTYDLENPSSLSGSGTMQAVVPRSSRRTA